MELEEMRRLKVERGYSIRQIAEYSGVPEGTVRKIFEGRTAHPRVATMIALARIFEGDESKYQGKRYRYDMQAAIANYEEFLAEAGSAPPRVEETVFAYGGHHVMTIKDYEELPDDCRCELIDGVLYDMGAPIFLHQDIVAEFIMQIGGFLKNTEKNCKVVPGPVDVHILQDDYNMVQPDVVVACRERNRIGRRIEGAPPFVLEIVSRSSIRRDYVMKLNKYSAAGVEEYWILDPMKKMICIYTNENDYVPEIIAIEGSRALSLFDGSLEIDLDEIAQIIETDETLIDE